jgi:hypothetical protein
VDLDKILYGGDSIEYYLDYILFNPVASTIPKWRTFKLLWWMLLLKQLLDSDEILYEDDDTEDDPDYTLINPIASIIPKWWTFKICGGCNF